MSKKKVQLISFILFIAFSIIFVTACLLFKDKIENLINRQSNFENFVIDEDGLTVHFIDVGQADSTVIEFPDGKTMLVDAGARSSTEDLVSYIDNFIFDDKNAVFDYVMLTHSDEDHCGGMPTILEKYDIGVVYRPKIFSTKVQSDVDMSASMKTSTTNIYRDTINAINTYADAVYFTDLDLCVRDNILIENVEFDYEIRLFGPVKDYYTDVNDFSPIMTIEYNDKTIMLTGDASKQNETEFLSYVENGIYDLPNVDIISLGHHGSKTSSSQDFLSSLTNNFQELYIIISCGLNNSYGHPSQETLDTLSYLNIPKSNIYKTYENGTIVYNVCTNGSFGIISDNANQVQYIKIEYIIIGGVVCIGMVFFSLSKTLTTKKRNK